MKHIILDETDSTNSWVKQHIAELDDLTMVSAVIQSAGRGQRGNSWEAAPGKNLTLSVLKRHDSSSFIDAAQQFCISEAVALAVLDFLLLYRIDALIKWPNDIYVGEKKIAGILIEHAVSGRALSHSILGIGLNVNQVRFLSNAPNPISMCNILGRETNLQETQSRISESLEHRLNAIYAPETRSALHMEFMAKLWRGGNEIGWYLDVDSGLKFKAHIHNVEPSGHLILREIPSGTLHRYAFKEVVQLLNPC